jgi:hypothetical protein
MALYFGDSEIKADKVSSPTGSSTLDIAGRKLINASLPVVYNVMDYGAKADGRTVNDGAMTSASATLTSSTAAFTSGDVGKLVTVFGAGAVGTSNMLLTTISSVGSGTSATLAATAANTVSGAQVFVATNDKTAITNAIIAAGQAQGGQVYLPPGFYGIGAHILANYSKVNVTGAGIQSSVMVSCYDGSPGGENTNFGILSFRSPDGTTPVSNISVSNLSINHNYMGTIGIHWQAPTSAANTATNLVVEKCEFYNRGPDNTGSTGSLRINGQYSGVSGALSDLRISNCIFRDAVSTNSSNVTANSILFTSYNISNVRILSCTFKNTFGNTIQTVGGTPARLRRDWVIDNCDFYNTVGTYANNYFGSSLADISDSVAAGWDGLKITNCNFESLPTSWPLQANNAIGQYYNMTVYHSDGFIVDSCTFKYSCTVIAPGLSNTGTPKDPSSAESRGWIFSNNSAMNCHRFSDPDGHTAGIYSNNLFFNFDHGTFMGGYGWHVASSYIGNSFINCGMNPRLASSAGELAIFQIEDGGNVYQDNFIYNDNPLTNPASAPTAAINATAGNLNGAYTYKITFVTPMGNETAASSASNSVSPVNQQVNLTNIPLGPAGTVFRNVYRTAAGGVNGTQAYIFTIRNNSSTTYTDNLADSGLGIVAPTTNNTNNGLSYIFDELGAGGYSLVPNVFKNNTIMGSGPSVATFYLDSRYQHIISGNTGILEPIIQNSLNNGTVSTTPLALTDVVTNNFQTSGTPVDNPTIFGGSIATAYTAVTTTYSVALGDSIIDCTSGTFTVTLPTAIGITGRQYTIKNSGTGTITVATTSSQTIDGATTQVMGVQYDSITVISDNANWKIV